MGVKLRLMGFFLVLSFFLGCSIGDESTQSRLPLPTDGERNILVSMVGLFSLLIRASFPNREQFAIGDDFSNARPYIEVVRSDGEWKSSSSSIFGVAGTIDYLVHFPIGWSLRKPYGFFDGGFGVFSSDLVFPRGVNASNVPYALDFSKLGMEVHNSGFGDAKKYVITSDDLFQTYFVLGPFEQECRFSGRKANFSVVFGKGKGNGSFCKNIIAMASYYTEEFGDAQRMGHSYEIGFFPARAYSSYHFGFYYLDSDYELIAHELFHAWEPLDKCSGTKLEEEFFASYMQVEAQYKAKILDWGERDALFKEKYSRLRPYPAAYFSLSDNELVSLRKQNATAYSDLVYLRGSIIGWLMEREGMPPEKMFNEHVETGNCTKLSETILHFNKVLLDGLEK
jgi:hypothetical protein